VECVRIVDAFPIPLVISRLSLQFFTNGEVTPTSPTHPHASPQALHNAGCLTWGSGPRGGVPAYTGLDVIIVRDEKIAALYVFLNSPPA